eukprot:g10516.t1
MEDLMEKPRARLKEPSQVRTTTITTTIVSTDHAPSRTQSATKICKLGPVGGVRTADGKGVDKKIRVHGHGRSRSDGFFLESEAMREFYLAEHQRRVASMTETHETDKVRKTRPVAAVKSSGTSSALARPRRASALEARTPVRIGRTEADSVRRAGGVPIEHHPPQIPRQPRPPSRSSNGAQTLAKPSVASERVRRAEAANESGRQVPAEQKSLLRSLGRLDLDADMIFWNSRNYLR